MSHYHPTRPGAERELVEEAVLPTAVRVWAVRSEVSAQSAKPAQQPMPERQRVPKRRFPAEALVFDTETREETGQRLLLGVWRLYRDSPDTGRSGHTCIEEGFFYPDDLPQRDPGGWQQLRDYAATHQADLALGFPAQLQCVPLSWWLEHRLYRYGDQHRNRCDLVGFNLPFDLGALASHWAPAEKRYRGGWSLGLWGRFDDDGAWHDQRFHRRILLNSIDPRRTLFGWGSRTDPDKPELAGASRFVDLRTLAFALTDRSHTLGSAAAAFGGPFDKPPVSYGVIDEAMLHYAREDVRHTATLYRNCLTELARHKGVELQPQRLYSPAGVGAAYLKAMGVTPPLDKFTDLDPQILGWAMSAFYGGRAEARIVRTPVPVVVADFTSMYPALNALLDTWPMITAARLSVDDATEPVRQLLQARNLVELLLDPLTWRHRIGMTLVQLDHPDGVVLPVRAGYEPGARDYGIGVNPLTYDGQLWYALPDVLAAALLSDAPITVTRAVRLRPHGQQSGLRPVQLRGSRRVDPRSTSNPFVAMIEERHRTRHATDQSSDEKIRLDLFLKITANATAYGSLARFDRRDETHPVPVTVHGPGEHPFADRTRYPEDPGPYCFPPVAASITAGARLMLALIERLLGDQGGTYAFMDTDSIAILATPDGGPVPCPTATGDTVTAVSHQQVRQLLRRFEHLNPYGRDVVNDDPCLGRSPWKVEHDSLRQPIWCYAIASKRYALYRPTGSGPQLVQLTDEHQESATDTETEVAPEIGDVSMGGWSEHGLGLYLDPTEEQHRDNRGRLWIHDAWQWLLTSALTGTSPPLPGWADRYAVTQFSISTPRHASWFQLLDTGGHTPGKPRPFGFGLLGHLDPFAAALVDNYPAAPYAKDPHQWPNLPWYDRRTGQPISTTNAATLGHDPQRLADHLAAGTVPLRTLGQILQTYGDRPEHKSLSPDGTPAGPRTHGQLRRRPLRSAPPLTALIGKEGNRLLERATGEITDPADYRTTYANPDTDRWPQLVLPVLTAIRNAHGTKHIAEQVGISDRQVRKWLTGQAQPHSGATRHRQKAKQLAVDWATQQLQSEGMKAPADPSATLYAYKTLPSA